MKKTIIALFALNCVAYGAELHGITFSAPTTLGRFQTNANARTGYHLIDGEAYGNLENDVRVGGLYITEGSYFRLNGVPRDLTLSYLYIAADDAAIYSNLKTNIPSDTALGWAEPTPTLTKVKVNNGGWVDINDSFDRIDVSLMRSGSIYLNTAGALTLAENTSLNEGVTVYATITDTATERTLLTANFSNWGGKVVLQNADGTAYDAGDYKWKATAEGLQIVRAVPEPTTATLSLLALAGLAVRRRRK